MITVSQYDSLLSYARKISRGTPVDPFDVVHTAIVANEDCRHNDVKTAFWRIRHQSMMNVEFCEERLIQKLKPKNRICASCTEDLPLGAFTYRSRGQLRNMCDRCLCKKSHKWRTDNLEAARKREREYARKNAARKNETAKKWYILNKESALARIKEWQADNPDRVKATKKKSDKKRRPQIRRNLQIWRKKNPDKVKMYQAKHRARKKAK